MWQNQLHGSAHWECVWEVCLCVCSIYLLVVWVVYGLSVCPILLAMLSQYHLWQNVFFLRMIWLPFGAKGECECFSHGPGTKSEWWRQTTMRRCFQLSSPQSLSLHGELWLAAASHPGHLWSITVVWFCFLDKIAITAELSTNISSSDGFFFTVWRLSKMLHDRLKQVTLLHAADSIYWRLKDDPKANESDLILSTCCFQGEVNHDIWVDLGLE